MAFPHRHPLRVIAFAALTVAAAVGACERATTPIGPPAAVASVDVTPATATAQAGQSVQLSATPKDVNGLPLSGRTVTWASSNPSVATVSNAGLASAVTAGSTTITATSEGKSGTSSITVTNIPVTSVDVAPPTATVQTGLTVQLTATPRDVNGTALSGRAVSWSSSNTSVATVNGSGLVTAVTPGAAAITATEDVPLVPSLVAVIVAEPGVTAETRPALLTVATDVLLLAHVTVRPESGSPLTSFGVALSCTV